MMWPPRPQTGITSISTCLPCLAAALLLASSELPTGSCWTAANFAAAAFQQLAGVGTYNRSRGF